MGRAGKYILLTLMVTMPLISGCAPVPSKSNIEEVIVKHFEAKQYKVLELNVGSLKPIPAKEKRYMGTPGYIVDVKNLLLEIPEDSGPPWNYRKGQRVSFNNVQITIRQGTGQNKEWLIAHITGVSVP